MEQDQEEEAAEAPTARVVTVMVAVVVEEEDGMGEFMHQTISEQSNCVTEFLKLWRSWCLKWREAKCEGEGWQQVGLL